MPVMALFISHRLARLIKKRSYASGEVAIATRRVESIRLQLAAAKESFRAVKRQLAAIDAEIKQIESELDVQAIAARRHTPRRIAAKRGTLLGEIIQYMQDATGPVPLHTVTAHVAQVVGLPMDSMTQRNYAHERIRRELNKLKVKGAVARMENAVSSTGRAIGCWIWTGL